MADKEPTLKGIHKSAFNSWKHHPITKLFRDYLEKKRDDVKDGVFDAWAGGALDLSTEHEARGAFNTFNLVAELLGPDKDGNATFEEIRGFYRDIGEAPATEEGDEEDDAAEDDETAEDQD